MIIPTGYSALKSAMHAHMTYHLSAFASYARHHGAEAIYAQFADQMTQFQNEADQEARSSYIAAHPHLALSAEQRFWITLPDRLEWEFLMHLHGALSVVTTDGQALQLDLSALSAAHHTLVSNPQSETDLEEFRLFLRSSNCEDHSRIDDLMRAAQLWPTLHTKIDPVRCSSWRFASCPLFYDRQSYTLSLLPHQQFRLTEVWISYLDRNLRVHHLHTGSEPLITALSALAPLVGRPLCLPTKAITKRPIHTPSCLPDTLTAPRMGRPATLAPALEAYFARYPRSTYPTRKPDHLTWKEIARHISEDIGHSVAHDTLKDSVNRVLRHETKSQGIVSQNF